MDTITAIFTAITDILAALLDGGKGAYTGVAEALSSVIEASSADK